MIPLELCSARRPGAASCSVSLTGPISSIPMLMDSTWSPGRKPGFDLPDFHAIQDQTRGGPEIRAQLVSFNFLKSTDLGGRVKLCAHVRAWLTMAARAASFESPLSEDEVLKLCKGTNLN
jgi:hypothetical protein